MSLKEPKESKNLPQEVKNDMDTYSPEKLKDIVVSSNMQLEELIKELKENKQYQAAALIKKDLEDAQRDTKKILRAKIKYSLYLLELKGKA